MRTVLLILCALSANVAVAAEGPGPVAAVNGFLASFNKGDVKAAEATHADDVTIVDEIPPYHWQGREAFKSWLADLGKHDQASGVTDGHMKVGNVVREEGGGDRAYVVMATEYTFKEKGVPMREPSQMTFALRKIGDTWRIVSWTFAGPKPTPASATAER